MKSRKSGNTFVVRLEKGEKIAESVRVFCEKNKISGAHFCGIGAASRADISYYSLGDFSYHPKIFEGEFEILNITGNVSLVDGRHFVHAHITLSDREFHAFGGHLNEAIAGPTLEIAITPLEGMERKFDEETRLKLLDLDQE